MRRTAIAFVVFAALCIPAQAQRVDLSNEDAAVVFAGLSQLDGYDRVVKEGAGEKVVREFYKFGGGFRMQLAQTIGTLRGVVATFQEANNALIRQFAKGGSTVPDDVRSDFLTEQQKLIKAPSGASVAKIKATELKLDENPIPVSVLSQLLPILDN